MEYTNQLGNFDDNQSAGIAPFVFDAKAGYETPFGGVKESGQLLGRLIVSSFA